MAVLLILHPLLRILRIFKPSGVLTREDSVAQLVEQMTLNHWVDGSNPSGVTSPRSTCCGVFLFTGYIAGMNRRSFIATATAALAGTQLQANPYNMNNPEASFDHIIFAVSTLESGIRILKERTGVEATIGGVHPHLGTQNALLSLGNDVYLEILAPDPKGKLVDTYQFINNLHEGKLIQWAAHTKDIDALLKAANDNGYEHSGINAGQRNTPDGKTLTWKTLMVKTPVDEVMPFFIQWGSNTPHPATTSPKGCSLKSMTLTHPDPGKVKEAFSTFGIQADVKAGIAGLTMKLKTPNGDVSL